ncbi:RING-H2 finger protein ATL65 [Tripterygium wilfordii]|uniref:RING-type E3 ubiquitin transferase n=1 Tax=Tripterygium wilfordii TaxID=458696 RepID=A0A7J7DH08_TRIWF|nr:RING-H2 finger protein ATL65 [Tripterygium wilfordii]KAF5745647.1 RING-H2 finger protein ATL65 [Tripterygium wilfordii]
MMIAVPPALPPSPQAQLAPSHHHHNHNHHHQSSQSLTSSTQSPPPSKVPIDFSPPLIAIVVIVATAFILVTCSRLLSRHLLRLLRKWRQWRRRRRRLRRFLPSSNGDLDSPPPFSSPSFFDTADGFYVYSPYGLDDSAIKSIPLSVYTAKAASNRIKDCAVCLLEFEDDDYVRTLPVCYHAFHVDCIDIWLRSHANCPLCRAGIFRPESPFIPLMAARIRPSLDDAILRRIALETITEPPAPQSGSTTTVPEITPCIEEPSPARVNNLEERFHGHHMLLKRSYSFGFERSLPSERMVMEPATTSPWRFRRGSGNFWSKRPSPFGSLSKPRVFSFRYYRGIKSPFIRRRGFFPLSERFSGSSRRSKSMTSPMFLRSAASAFSSSRLRCGDPEALLSPERLNRR